VNRNVRSRNLEGRINMAVATALNGRVQEIKNDPPTGRCRMCGEEFEITLQAVTDTLRVDFLSYGECDVDDAINCIEVCPDCAFGQLSVSDKIDALSASLHPLDPHRNWHDLVLGELEIVIESGLPEPCRGQVEAFLFDLVVGDMPWNDEQREAVCKAILEDDRWPTIRRHFEGRFGVDLAREDGPFTIKE